MNQSLPYTGSSSASFATQKSKEVQQSQDTRKREAADQRERLLPYEKIITNHYDELLADLKDYSSINVKAAVAVGNHALEIEMLAREELIKALTSSKTALLNKMRDNKS